MTYQLSKHEIEGKIKDCEKEIDELTGYIEHLNGEIEDLEEYDEDDLSGTKKNHLEDCKSEKSNALLKKKKLEDEIAELTEILKNLRNLPE